MLSFKALRLVQPKHISLLTCAIIPKNNVSFQLVNNYNGNEELKLD